MEERFIKILNQCKRPNGMSTYTVECPFCESVFEMQIWSYSTTGKKCGTCGAVLRSGKAIIKKNDSQKHL